MDDFEISDEELKRIPKEAEERYQAEQDRRREAQCNPNEAGIDAIRHKEANACPKCGFSLNGDEIRCGHCKYSALGPTSLAAPRPPDRRQFFPHLDPSTPVSEVFRSPFGKLLLICWIPNVVLLIVIGAGLWLGPPEAEYPSATKTEQTVEDRRVALVAYERHKAFNGIWDAAFAAAIGGPLALGLGLYVILTQGKTPDFNYVSAKVKSGWGLIAIAGGIMIVGAPVFVGYNIWRYNTL